MTRNRSHVSWWRGRRSNPVPSCYVTKLVHRGSKEYSYMVDSLEELTFLADFILTFTFVWSSLLLSKPVNLKTDAVEGGHRFLKADRISRVSQLLSCLKLYYTIELGVGAPRRELVSARVFGKRGAWLRTLISHNERFIAEILFTRIFIMQ